MATARRIRAARGAWAPDSPMGRTLRALELEASDRVYRLANERPEPYDDLPPSAGRPFLWIAPE